MHSFDFLRPGATQLAILGYVAACCTTLSFVPQISKIKKQGGKDLSYSMLGIYLIGLNLWLLYGIILREAPIMIANIASILLVVYAIVMKALTTKSRATD